MATGSDCSGESDDYTDTGSNSSETNGDTKPVHRIPHHLHPTIERDDFGRGHAPANASQVRKTDTHVSINVDQISTST